MVRGVGSRFYYIPFLYKEGKLLLDHIYEEEVLKAFWAFDEILFIR